MGFLDVNRHHFAILLRGGKACVAKQLLDVADIRSLLQHVGGATSPEGVRGGALVDPGLSAVRVQAGLQGGGSHGLSLVVEEEPPFLRLLFAVVGPDLLQVLFQKARRRLPEGDDPLFAPFPLAHVNDPFAQVHVMHVQGEKLVSSHRRCVKDFHDGPVTNPAPEAHIRLLKELFHFLLGEGRADLLVSPVRLDDPLGGVDEQLVVLGQVLEEPFHRPDPEGLGLHGLCSRHDLCFIVEHDLFRHGAQVGDVAGLQVLPEPVEA